MLIPLILPASLVAAPRNVIMALQEISSRDFITVKANTSGTYTVSMLPARH